MLKRRLYYSVKPYMPRWARMAFRRFEAHRILKTPNLNWPISESAATPPHGWRGWPEGNRFALLLTHDVEGPEGLESCRQVAELELDLGFRSSFNFIPEGSYTVPPDLRRWLVSRGFEVGIHDLHHDGKLFNSHEAFRANAPRINRYLSEWGASGFRAGFMMRNLDWYHDLDIQYDTSTFDSDPFEPMPDGVNTNAIR